MFFFLYQIFVNICHFLTFAEHFYFFLTQLPNSTVEGFRQGLKEESEDNCWLSAIILVNILNVFALIDLTLFIGVKGLDLRN